MFRVAVMLVMAIRGPAQVVVPTDTAPPGPRTGMIVGQVVEAATGSPVSEAIVSLTMPKYSNDPTAPKGRVMADGEGRFFFSDLPAGDYYMQATKDGYAPGAYGQRQPSGQNLLLSLGEGERITDVKLRVWKFVVIGGTVVDEAGEPVVGVAVRALLKDVIGGRTGYGNAPWLVPTTTTDDRGMFRLAQMTPATYVIAAPSTHTSMPAAVMETPAAALRSELFFAGVQELPPLGQPRTQQMGDVALLTLSTVPTPPAASTAGRMAVYRTTFYPAATTARNATAITLAAGEERTDLVIALQPVPAVRVSGRLITPDGSPPPPTPLKLAGDALAEVIVESLPSGQAEVGFETVTGMSDAAGRFTLLGVPPGEYILQQASHFLSRATEQGGTAYWIFQRITVGADDLSDLTVNLRPAFRVEGRVEFRGANGSPPAPGAMVPRGVGLEKPYGEPGSRVFVQTASGATPAFATVAAGGQYIVRPTESSGWFVQTITAGGKDITDRVFDLQADTNSLVVTYTDRPSKVSGTVKDSRGDANTTAIVLAFPVDPRRWSGYGPSPRTLKTALTSRTGTYTFDHLPAGDYYVIAIDPAAADGWKDPKTLEALAGLATRLTVATGDTAKTLDLTLKAIR